MKRKLLILSCLVIFGSLWFGCSEEEENGGSLITALELSGATLSPAFSVGTSVYTATVAHAVESVTLLPQFVEGVTATLTLNGAPLAPAGDSWVIPLAVGANTVVLTAALDTKTNTCTITITRAAPPGNDPSLSAITFDTTTYGFSFDPAVTNYVFTTGLLTIKLTPTATDPQASILIAVKDVTNTIASGEASETITLSSASGGGTMEPKPGLPPTNPYVIIYLHVTAENGIDKRSYRLYISQP